MNNEIKVSLTITLPGGVMESKDECLKTTQKVIEKKTKTGKVYKKKITLQVDDWDKMDHNSLRVEDAKGKNPEIIHFYTRRCKPVLQVIKFNKDSYEYMISKEYPSWAKPWKWNQMNKKERLETHIQRTAKHFGGEVVSYQVFED